MLALLYSCGEQQQWNAMNREKIILFANNKHYQVTMSFISVERLAIYNLI